MDNSAGILQAGALRYSLFFLSGEGCENNHYFNVRGQM